MNFNNPYYPKVGQPQYHAPPPPPQAHAQHLAPAGHHAPQAPLPLHASGAAGPGSSVSSVPSGPSGPSGPGGLGGPGPGPGPPGPGGAPLDDTAITVHNTTPGQNRRGPWLPREDHKLMELIAIFGPSNWVRISNTLNTRTPKQCRERYHQNLKPSLNRTPITNDEGELIEKLVAKYGKKWAEIARHLNGRLDNAIKNWWNGGANRRRRASTQVGLRPPDERDSDDEGSERSEPAGPAPSDKPLPPPPALGGASQYPQVPHLPQISFNTSMFGDAAPPPAQPPPFNRPTALRLASFDTHPHSLPHLAHVLPNIPPLGPHGPHVTTTHVTTTPPVAPPLRQAHAGPSGMLPLKRRLLEELQGRRHLAHTIYLAPAPYVHTNSNPNLVQTAAGVSGAPAAGGAVLPYYGSPLLMGHPPLRHNSILQYELLTLLSNNSSATSRRSLRRSSIAPDFFPNPLKEAPPSVPTATSPKLHKRNASQSSFNSSTAKNRLLGAAAPAAGSKLGAKPDAGVGTGSADADARRKSKISVASLID